MGRIREIRHGNREDPGGLRLVDRTDRARPAPPPQDGRHHEAADGDVEPRQHAEDLHTGRVEAGLLLGLAKRRPHRTGSVGIAVLRVEGAAGEPGLAGMRAQGPGAFHQEQLGAAGAVAEEDQHRGLPAAALRRQEAAELARLDRRGRAGHRGQPLGQAVGRDRGVPAGRRAAHIRLVAVLLLPCTPHSRPLRPAVDRPSPPSGCRHEAAAGGAIGGAGCPG